MPALPPILRVAPPKMAQHLSFKYRVRICGKSPLRLPLKCLAYAWLRYVCVIVLELAARAGIGRGKPCGLIITAFAVIIFVSDIVLLIVCACYVQGFYVLSYCSKVTETLQDRTVGSSIMG